MDIKAEGIKDELQFKELVVCVNTSADENISTYGVKAEIDVDIENQYQNNKILGNTVKEEPDDYEEEIWETNITKKEKEESRSDDEDEESLPEIKTEELMLKSESEVDDSEKGAHWDSRMKDHLINENLTKKHGFDNCDHRTYRKGDLESHVMTQHDKNSIKKYCCEHCEYRSHCNVCLRKHILAKHDNNSDKKYSYLESPILNKHGNNPVKNRVKKYGCDYCNYRTYLRCDYRTHRKDTLKCHVKTHDKNSSNKYDCVYCDYRTHCKDTLKWHVKTHDKNSSNKYDCVYCDYSAYQKSKLECHVMTQHKLQQKIQLRFMRLYDPPQRPLSTPRNDAAP